MRKDILKVIVLVCIFVVQMIMTTLVQAQPNGCPTDMVHYWKMDESSQPYTDFYGANNATCTNCPAATTGIVNGAQQFNLTAQVNVADDNTFDWSVTDSFSIEFWMKTDSSSTCSGNQVIMGRTNPFWWIGCLSNTGVAYFELNDTGENGMAINGSTDLTDGNWHHIAAVRDSNSNEIRLYVDGVKEGAANTAYSSGFGSANVPLTIGWLNLAGGFHFVGTMDEIALYNRAISEGEIRSHYYLARGYCEMCASPVRIMPLGDSITYGRNNPALEPHEQASPNEVVGYRQQLYLSLLNSGYDVNFVGSSHDGELAATGFDIDHEGRAPIIGSLTAQDLAANVYDFVSANPPEAILLHIGTNNILNTTANDVAAVLDEIDRFSTRTTILLARIINVKDATDPRYNAIIQFNNDVEAMAMSRTNDKIIMVDQEHALSYPNDMYDILHPNATGYGKMAAAWNSALSAFLPSCGSAAPKITSNAVTMATVNQLYWYNVNATANPPATYSLVTAPPGMTIDQSTGFISWTPAASGSFDVVVQADNAQGTDTQNYTIQVASCPANMIHYWKLDESNQPYLDLYGTEALCAYCPSATTGIVSGAQQFNLASRVDVVDDSTFDWSVSDSFSIEFWMKTDSSSTCSGNQVMVGRTDPFWWVGCLNSTGVPYFELNDKSGSGASVQGGTAVTDGNWHHIVAVKDSNAIHLYVDGVQYTTNITYSSGFDSAYTALTMGWLNLSGGFHFVGSIDETALYNRALSAAEIQQHYSNGLVGNGYCSSAYTISASVSGGNGTISCTSPVSHGSTSTCTITANTGYHLSALTDNGSNVVSAVTGNNPYAYTITNVTANHTVVASFATNTYTLTVSKSGNGSGTVTSSPPGINCGSDCSEPYNAGTIVTLTATPDANSTFTWTGGGCSGTGLCVLTMNADTTATATFTLNQYTVTPAAGPNGSISPSTPQTVNHGSSIQFTITPNISYRVADVKVDGSSVGAVTSYTFTNVTANHTIEATFIGMYSISGTVTSGGSPLSGVTMTLGGAGSGNTLTDASGNYSFSGLANGAYTVTSNKAGYKFNPVSRVVTISGGSVTGQNFAGTLTINRTYGISGAVTSGGSPLSGVTMTLGGAGSGSTLTDASGNYSFSGLANGAYTVTPSLGGHTFTPTSRNVAISGASVTGQNFTGTATGGTYGISGTVTSGGSPIQGVTISGSGGCSGFTTTNSNGDYTLAGIPDGSTCTVMPSKSAYTFTPTSRTVTINGANVTGQDFVGTPGAITYSISGYVKTPDRARPGSPISGVTMSLSGTGCSGSTSTGSNGNYIFTGLSDGVTCTITPSKTGYTFSPASRSVTINNANVTGQDFVRQ